MVRAFWRDLDIVPLDVNVARLPGTECGDECRKSEQETGTLDEQDPAGGNRRWIDFMLLESVELAEKACIAHSAGEPPRSGEKFLAATKIASHQPGSREEESAHDIVVEKCGRKLPPGVPSPDRIKDRSE